MNEHVAAENRHDIEAGRFAGVDWASEEHAVCVVDEYGRIVEGRRYRA